MQWRPSRSEAEIAVRIDDLMIRPYSERALHNPQMSLTWLDSDYASYTPSYLVYRLRRPPTQEKTGPIDLGIWLASRVERTPSTSCFIEFRIIQATNYGNAVGKLARAATGTPWPLPARVRSDRSPCRSAHDAFDARLDTVPPGDRSTNHLAGICLGDLCPNTSLQRTSMGNDLSCRCVL